MVEKLVKYCYVGYIKCSHNYILHCNTDHRCQVKILSSKSRETILKKRDKKTLSSEYSLVSHKVILKYFAEFPRNQGFSKCYFYLSMLLCTWNKILCLKNLLPAVLSFVSQQGQLSRAGNLQCPLYDARILGERQASPYCQVLPRPKASLDNCHWIWPIIEPYSWKTSQEVIQSISLPKTGLSTAVSFLTDVFFLAYS